jgi:hypothetical protein
MAKAEKEIEQSEYHTEKERKISSVGGGGGLEGAVSEGFLFKGARDMTY